MGGGVSKLERREKEQHRHRLLKNVERFVINVYATCPRVESMRYILSSEMACKAFGNFLASERAEEALKLHSEIVSLKKIKQTPYQFMKAIEVLVATYIQPEVVMQVLVSKRLREDLLAVLTADRDDEDLLKNVDNLLDKTLEETIFIMARDQFHRFIVSKYYKTWRAAESSHAIAHTSDDATEAVKKKPPLKSMPSSRSISSSATRLNRRKKDEDLSVRAFAHVDARELGKVLGSESWLASLLAAVEALPICFSLATARRDRRGFPLMYVNKHFEKITGFTRADVLGKNCRFLQCEETEKESVQILSEALRQGQPAQVIMMNRTGEGKPFRNLVCLKPVHDDKQRFLYVMSISVDVTREVDEGVAKMRLATDLISMLPDIIITDDLDDKACFPFTEQSV